MTNELAKRYGEIRSREEQITDEELRERIRAAEAQARGTALHSAAGAAAQGSSATSCVAMIVAGLFALAAIFG